MKVDLIIIYSILLFATKLPAQITHVYGTYTGDGAASQAITGIGFQPDVIFVKPDASYDPWVATSSMTAGDCRLLNTNTQLTTGVVTTLDADGFTVALHNSSNNDGTVYHFTAFEEGTHMDVGSYTGATTSITTNGGGGDFQPEMIWLFGDSNDWYDYSGYSMRSDGTVWQWDGTEDNASYPLIGAYGATGFTTGTGSRTAAKVYHYVAFNADGTDGLNSSYTGDNANPRDVAMTFDPSFLIMHRSISDNAPIYMKSFGSEAGRSVAEALNSTYITGVHGTGITVTNNGAVNIGAATYHYFNLKGGSVLPVELIYFRAKNISDQVNLISWSTAAELNSDYFNIERSQDGEFFEVIGTVSGAGNSDQVIEYEFEDAYPKSGNNYYRLRQVDFDGGDEVFNVVVVNQDKGYAFTRMDVKPNPSVDKVYVGYESNENGVGKVLLIDNHGKVAYSSNVYVYEGPNDFMLEVLEYMPGLYTLTVQLPNGTLISNKIMVGN